MSLYLKLLESKVEELKSGKKPWALLEILIELDLNLVLDDSLFTSSIDKINFYRNIESITSLEELTSFEAEWTGTESPALNTLILLIRARILLAEHRVKSIKRILWDYVFVFEWANTDTIRRFIGKDTWGDFLVQSLERVKVTKSVYTSDLDFLQKLVYSLGYDNV